jgi:hypothetical protein
MKFINKTKMITVEQAIKDAEALLRANSKMMFDIFQKTDWKYDSGAPADIVLKLLQKRDPIDVYYYKPLYPWSSALGYFDGEAIYINYKKILNHTALVGLLLHEYAHYCGFKHDNNYKSKDKVLYSVPYWLSENVKYYL